MSSVSQPKRSRISVACAFAATSFPQMNIDGLDGSFGSTVNLAPTALKHFTNRAFGGASPEDVTLHSNLALAMLIGGDLDEAVATAQAALARDPSDPIIRNLVDHIGKVQCGLAKRPTRI